MTWVYELEKCLGERSLQLIWNARREVMVDLQCSYQGYVSCPAVSSVCIASRLDLYCLMLPGYSPYWHSSSAFLPE